jgi:transposase InsO family protein
MLAPSRCASCAACSRFHRVASMLGGRGRRARGQSVTGTCWPRCIGSKHSIMVDTAVPECTRHCARRATAVVARVERMMRRHDIRALESRGFRPRTTDSRHSLPAAPNSLAQRLLAPAPSRIWLADITYIATGDGWLYLAAILDLATHDRGMGIAGSHADRIGARGPADGRTTPAPRARAHSPFGPLESTQYAASAYSSQLAELGAIASMSRRGCCYDNAPMEAFPYVEGRARPAA